MRALRRGPSARGFLARPISQERKGCSIACRAPLTSVRPKRLPSTRRDSDFWLIGASGISFGSLWRRRHRRAVGTLGTRESPGLTPNRSNQQGLLDASSLAAAATAAAAATRTVKMVNVFASTSCFLSAHTFTSNHSPSDRLFGTSTLVTFTRPC